jgi:hypothetical protein
MRVMKAHHLLKESRPDNLFVTREPLVPLNQDNEAARHNAMRVRDFDVKSEGLDDMSRYIMQQHFMAGLHEELRIKTMELAPPDLDAAFKRAMELEIILKDKRGSKPLVSAIKQPSETEEEGPLTDEDESDIELEDQINSLLASKGKRPIRFVHRKGKGSFKNKGRVTCRYCKKIGHFQRECMKRKREGGAMIDSQGKPFKNSVTQVGEEEEDQQNEPDEQDQEEFVQSIAGSYYGINSIKADRSDWFDDTSSQNPLTIQEQDESVRDDRSDWSAEYYPNPNNEDNDQETPYGGYSEFPWADHDDNISISGSVSWDDEPVNPTQEKSDTHKPRFTASPLTPEQEYHLECEKRMEGITIRSLTMGKVILTTKDNFYLECMKPDPLHSEPITQMARARARENQLVIWVTEQRIVLLPSVKLTPTTTLPSDYKTKMIYEMAEVMGQEDRLEDLWLLFLEKPEPMPMICALSLNEKGTQQPRKVESTLPQQEEIIQDVQNLFQNDPLNY